MRGASDLTASTKVEIHACNGDLNEEFLSTNWNKRTDDYGGSPENRSRFLLEVVDATIEAVGASKIGVRIGPWSPFQSKPCGTDYHHDTSVLIKC